MLFVMPMKGLRRNDDAMKTNAGITIPTIFILGKNTLFFLTKNG
jgi:hypothetical protein